MATTDSRRRRLRFLPYLTAFALAWLLFGWSHGVIQSGDAGPVRWAAPVTDPGYVEGRWLQLGVETRQDTLANRWLPVPSRHVRPAESLAQWEYGWRRAAVWAGSLSGVGFPSVFTVVAVNVGTPAARAGLLVGDDIQSVNGAPFSQWAGDSEASTAPWAPTGQIRLAVLRAGAVVEISWAQHEGQRGLGFRWAESGAVPESWRPEARAVGSSAGLAHGLAYLDATTPGDLTGGRVVAATGVLYADGTLTAVDGLAYKIPAAFAAGADVVLVAAGSPIPTVYVPDPRVVQVSSAQDAVTWLCRSGGVSSAC